MGESKMSDQKKLLIAAGLMAVVLFLSWQFLGGSRDPDPAPVDASAEIQTESAGPEVSPGDAAQADSTADEPGTEPEAARTDITIIIRDSGSDLVHACITPLGGAISSWALVGYEDMPGAGQNGSVNFNGTPWLGRGRVFRSDSPDTVIVDGEPRSVTLIADDGASIEYTFTPGFCGFRVETRGLTETMSISAGVLPVSEQGVNAQSYFKAEWNAEKIRNRRPGDIAEMESVGNVRWIATRSQYFAIIMMPESLDRAYAYLYPSGEDQSPAIGLSDEKITVYAGPLDYSVLRGLGRDTSRLIDFGWPLIREIGRLIFWFCDSLLSFMGNWGVKIILLSIVMKLVMLPLTTKSFVSMQKMKLVQPRMKELQEKYRKDPKAQQEALQRLYKEEGVSPLGGCLPLLLQMPVFFALYKVLANSVQLRGASFVLWMTDMSRPEILIPFGSPILGLSGIGLLAVLMGVAMFVQQKMTVTDQSQKAMLYMMPILMTFLFMRFPAGLTLYWFINNILTIAHQEMIKRKLESPARS
jgi:YidC/Oxa1 family membrane protein insertase